MTALFILVFLVVYVLCAVYAWSLYIRRLHDLGHSGWWSLLLLVPVLSFIGLIYLLFAKGDEGPNQYGGPNVGQPFWRSIFKPNSLAQAAPAQMTPPPSPPTQPAAPAAPVPPAPPPPPAAQ